MNVWTYLMKCIFPFPVSCFVWCGSFQRQNTCMWLTVFVCSRSSLCICLNASSLSETRFLSAPWRATCIAEPCCHGDGLSSSPERKRGVVECYLMPRHTPTIQHFNVRSMLMLYDIYCTYICLTSADDVWNLVKFSRVDEVLKENKG